MSVPDADCKCTVCVGPEVTVNYLLDDAPNTEKMPELSLDQL